MRTLRSRRQTNPPPETPPPASSFPTLPSALCSKSCLRSSRSLPRLVQQATNYASFSPVTRSDHVLRDLTIISITAAFALTFLNLFLYGAILAVGLLVPAWQTFKALERRPVTPPVEIIDLSDLDQDDADEDDDMEDEDWVPSGEHVRARRAAMNVEAHQEVKERTMEEHLGNWQAYWVMAALLFAGDGMLRPWISTLIPQSVYAAGLFSGVAWLTRNRGGNARVVYEVVVRPMFLKSEKVVDGMVGKVMEGVGVLSGEAVLKVNRWVEPYVRQLEHAADRARKEVEQVTENGGRRRRLF